MFNKVVRWRRLGEVENVYVAYIFSHFVIYLPKFIKTCGNFNEVLTKTIMHSFLRHGEVIDSQ